MAKKGSSQSRPDGQRVDDEKVRKAELAISLTLRGGVSLSVLVIVAGLVMTFVHHSDYVSRMSYKSVTGPGFRFPHSPGAVVSSLSRGDGQGVVVLGVLLLILTPVVRVAVSIFTFVYEKDRNFVIITSVVLAILVGSFFLGGVAK